jgi:hypothetical protein
VDSGEEAEDVMRKIETELIGMEIVSEPSIYSVLRWYSDFSDKLGCGSSMNFEIPSDSYKIYDERSEAKYHFKNWIEAQVLRFQSGIRSDLTAWMSSTGGLAYSAPLC